MMKKNVVYIGERLSRKSATRRAAQAKSHIVLILFIFLMAGCVERLITVNTNPAGAVVYLNDEEVGTSPVTVPFTWYGEYDVVIRKEGLKTVKTSRKAKAPIYQWPPLDLFFECLWPFDLVDRHQWDFELAVQEPTDPNALIERARSLRNETLAAP